MKINNYAPKNYKGTLTTPCLYFKAAKRFNMDSTKSRPSNGVN